MSEELPPEENFEYDEPDSYWCPADGEALAGMGYLLHCSGCKRKIHVSMGLIGVAHQFGVSATCAECLTPNEEWVKKFPKQAKQIADWQKVKNEEIK